jgi:hypothetical protein
LQKTTGIENTIMAPDWKPPPTFSTHFLLSGVVDRATFYCCPLHYTGISLGCSPAWLHRQQIFR